MAQRISADVNILGGKPCIKGTRITVSMILDLLEDGLTFEQILQDYYAHLSIDDLKACVEYVKAIIDSEEVYFAEEAQSPSNGSSRRYHIPR